MSALTRYRVLVERRRVIDERATVDVVATSRLEAARKAERVQCAFTPFDEGIGTPMALRIISELPEGETTT